MIHARSSMKSPVMKFSAMNSPAWAFAALTLLASGAVDAATLTPLASFGVGNGSTAAWREPGEVIPGDTAGTNSAGYYNYLGDAVNTGATGGGNLERGLAYNPATGHLILLSRSNVGNGIRILDGTTGADVGSLFQPLNFLTGGAFTSNMVGVADDGAIYVGNLSTSATANFKVYRWASETDNAPTTAFDGLSGITRTGDTLAVFGSGVNTKIAASGSNNVNASNFTFLSTTNGTSFTATPYTSVPGTATANNDYRLGLTFVDSDTIIGTQGGTAYITDISPTLATTPVALGGAALRSMDYAEIGGLKLLAVTDSNTSRLWVLDITNPAAPVAIANAQVTTIDPAANVNGNGTGSVAFGAISGNVAKIYALSSNQGISAFELTLNPAGPTNNSDFNNDGNVDGADFLIWQRGNGSTGVAANDKSTGDANGDGNVDATDLGIWSTKFGGAPAVAALGAVPEPATWVLAALALAGLSAVRRK